MPTFKPSAPEIVPATQANRRFSELLRGVREEGKTFTITSHGRAVARVLPPAADIEDQAVADVRREIAWKELMAHLQSKPVLNLPKFTRDDFYD